MELFQILPKRLIFVPVRSLTKVVVAIVNGGQNMGKLLASSEGNQV